MFKFNLNFFFNIYQQLQIVLILLRSDTGNVYLLLIIEVGFKPHNHFAYEYAHKYTLKERKINIILLLS